MHQVWQCTSKSIKTHLPRPSSQLYPNRPAATSPPPHLVRRKTWTHHGGTSPPPSGWPRQDWRWAAREANRAVGGRRDPTHVWTGAAAPSGQPAGLAGVPAARLAAHRADGPAPADPDGPAADAPAAESPGLAPAALAAAAVELRPLGSRVRAHHDADAGVQADGAGGVTLVAAHARRCSRFAVLAPAALTPAAGAFEGER
eukprot:350668-Chlamydomonas_euryale.AAC.1